MQAHAGARRDPRCWEGVVFFGFDVFVFSRRVVAWQFASHMRTDLVLDALRMALTHRDPRRRRQARASQRRRLAIHELHVPQVRDDHAVQASIGPVGDAYDNAIADSFVVSFKTELIRDRVWRTRSQLELAIVEYVAWVQQRASARVPR